MSHAPGRGPPSRARVSDGPTRRQFHLEAWDRYCRILEDQLACLESPEPDLERFHSLARQRARLAEMIDAMRLPPPDSPDAADQLARIGRRVADCQARDREVLDRLGSLRRETEKVIRGFKDRRTGREGYLAGTKLGRTPDDARIDVKS